MYYDYLLDILKKHVTLCTDISASQSENIADHILIIYSTIQAFLAVASSSGGAIFWIPAHMK
ncbi:hypothetical protein OUZ56_020923 [Daphnia magna]|uniref:Uncharacterized protein n=1 Tax=Daphnia magna TaxID=35525 RepID=A0ABQ9ZFV0_9CRUS|nr:hypothetical protein OUZ56_020923 [Daphnia magna]